MSSMMTVEVQLGRVSRPVRSDDRSGDLSLLGFSANKHGMLFEKPYFSTGWGRCFFAWLQITAGIVLLATPMLAAESHEKLLEFRGQVLLPANVLSPKKTLTLALFGVELPFTARTWAGSDGRFRFRDLKPGSYTLSIYIPNDGEILETVEITKSFADSKGRVEKKFAFDEESLHAQVRPMAQDMVSVRVLGIPARARGEYEKAEARLRHQDVDGAIQHLEKAIELAPQFAEALNNLGTIYFQKQEFSRAEQIFRTALQKDPQAYQPLVNLGGTVLAQGRLQEALTINLRAQSIHPADALANAQLGLCYFLLGEDDRALTYLETTKRIDPAHFSNPEIPLAEIHIHRSEKAAALRELDDFLKMHPDSDQTTKVRGLIEKLQTSQINSGTF